MTAQITWQIPPSVLQHLAEIPSDRPVAVLMRHSVRPYLAPGDAGYSLPITELGVHLACELGTRLSGQIRSIHTSPLLRCRQTAEALCAGASAELTIHPDRLLGDPGVFVVDNRRGGQEWCGRGHEAVMAHLVGHDEPLPGLSRPEPAARFLVHHMLATAGTTSGYHVFVTHDSLVTATAARLLKKPLGKEAWPWYLEAAFFWREDAAVKVAYRGMVGRRNEPLLCDLVHDDVIELARREIGRTIGLDCPARFFLAGGAFKTLLSGKSPRDLDLWAASPHDREVLVAALLERGATPLEPRPYTDVFSLGDSVLEVPHKAEPATLTERLARFDIALSAVGVEHLGGDRWSAQIHPLARASVEQRKVLLLKPLVNWRHALGTLERMRRYRDELGYEVPPEEEAEVWKVFEAQDPEMQRGMVDRFARTTRGSSVGAEAQCRLR